MRYRLVSRPVFVVAAVAAGVVPGAVPAEPSAEDAYRYRTSIMTAMRGHAGAASLIVRGIVADDGHLLRHAEGLATGAAELERIFQPGSDVGESEALPVIWEQPAEFADARSRAREAIENFRRTVARGADAAALGAAFKEVGDACRGCHDRFRADDD